MNFKLKMPCEIVVKYVLPAIRALLAKELIEKHGYSQVKAAELLGTSQSSISHYLNSKRGNKFLNDVKGEVSEEIEEIIKILTSNVETEKLMHEFCKICFKLRSGNLTCHLHKQHTKSPKPCTLCVS